jgi:hypothetical protein
MTPKPSSPNRIGSALARLALALTLPYPPRVNTRRLYGILFAFVALVALAACNKDKTETSMPLTYRNPGYEETVFKKLLVIGVSESDEGRKLFEDTFAKTLTSAGTTATPSYAILPQSEQLSEEQISKAIQGDGYDGVLITQVLSVDEAQEYVEGKSHTVAPRNMGYSGGYGYYGYYGFYSGGFATVHQPGYFKTHTSFRLETNLYSVANDGLVWSGQSDTVNPESLENVVDSMTAAVAKELKYEKLIP